MAFLRYIEGTLSAQEVLQSLQNAGYAVHEDVHKAGLPDSHGRWEIVCANECFEVHLGYKLYGGMRLIVQGKKGWKTRVLDDIQHILKMYVEQQESAKKTHTVEAEDFYALRSQRGNNPPGIQTCPYLKPKKSGGGQCWY